MGAAREATATVAQHHRPPQIQAARARTAAVTEKWVRKLGFSGAQISLEVAEALETRVTGALAKLAPRLVKAHPALVAPLRVALAGAG